MTLETDVVVSSYLPSRLGHLSEVGEMILDPHVDLLQRHLPALPTVYSKLDHGHVGVRRPLGPGLLENGCCSDLGCVCLCDNRGGTCLHVRRNTEVCSFNQS